MKTTPTKVLEKLLKMDKEIGEIVEKQAAEARRILNDELAYKTFAAIMAELANLPTDMQKCIVSSLQAQIDYATKLKENPDAN